jgi:heme exporter protein A
LRSKKLEGLASWGRRAQFQKPNPKTNHNLRMISAEKLGKRYGARWLFRHLSFSVAPGECLLISGANGSGKSTLLKLLCGLLPASEGKIHTPADFRKSIGLAALDQPVYPHLTVAEHLQLAGQLRGVEPRIQPLLEEVGLAYASHQLAKELSTGMRARLKFALAIQASPAVLLLDEPGAGLDAEGRQMLAGLIESRKTFTALILATNDPEERRFATHELALGT